MKKLFGMRLRIARQTKFNSCREAADAIGINEATFGSWERGRSLPNNLRDAKKLCGYFHLTMDWLFFGDTASLRGNVLNDLRSEARKQKEDLDQLFID